MSKFRKRNNNLRERLMYADFNQILVDLNLAWAIWSYVFQYSSAKEPKTLANVSSNQLLCLKWLSSKSHTSTFAYKTAWKVLYSTGSMSPLHERISMNSIKSMLSARQSRLFIKPIKYALFVPFSKTIGQRHAART